MPDDFRLPPRSHSGPERRAVSAELMDKFDEMRAERRDDLDALELRLMTAINGVRSDINGRLSGLEAFRQLVEERWDVEALKAAEQRGRLAVGLFVFNVVGRNWKLIATGAIAVLTATGSINISFGPK